MRFSHREPHLQPAASSALGHAVLGEYIKNRCQKDKEGYSSVMSHFFGFYGVPTTMVEWQMWLKLDGLVQRAKVDSEFKPTQHAWNACSNATDVLYARKEKAVKVWKPAINRHIDQIPFDYGEEKSFRRLYERACHEEGITV